jgi:hypothetical protein
VTELVVRGRAEGHLAPDGAALTVTVLGHDPGSADGRSRLRRRRPSGSTPWSAGRTGRA